MSKKSRLLALLLTLLMVVGMLPLAIFADEGTTESATTATDSFTSIKSTLENAGFDVYAYQDFEKFSDDNLTLGVKNYSNADVGNGISSPITYTANSTKYPFTISNRRAEFEIKKESDGNKALYLGNSNVSEDDFFDFIPNAYINGTGVDLYLSIDLKMGGDYISAQSHSLFNFISRQCSSGKRDVHNVFINGDGGIYCKDNGLYTDILGYINKNEYTTVSFLSDLQNNKYYLYINNILVTPNGCTFLTQDEITDFQSNSGNSSYSAADFRFDGVRVYNVGGTVVITDALHKGLYFDNLLMAGKLQLAKDSPATSARNIYTMDLSGVTNEQYIVDNETQIPGTGDYKIRRNGAASDGSAKMLQYWKDTDGTWIRYHKETAGATYKDQGYFTLTSHIENATPGANISYSIKLKAGSEQIVAGNILCPITRANGSSNQCVCYVAYDANRNLTLCGGYNNNLNKVSIGQIPTSGYITLEMQVVCSAANGIMLKAYIDGDFKGSVTLPIKDSWWKNDSGALTYNSTTLTASTLVLNDFHLNHKYDKGANALVDDDLYFSDLSIQYITKYNYTDAAVSNPLEVKPTGFNYKTGINRYFNGDGTYKTGEFYVGDVKYVAADTGSVTGKVSDGVIPSAYGTYTNWAHSGSSYLVNQPNGGNFLSMLDQTSNHRYGRAMTVKKNGEYARWINKYYGGDYWYHNDILSTVDGAKWAGTTEGMKNIVVDIDVMFGDTIGWGNIFTVMVLDSDGSNRNDVSVVDIDPKNGAAWLRDREKSNSAYMQMLSKTEFTRLSLVLKGNDGAGLTYDIYVNGVKFVADRALHDIKGNPAKQLHGVRLGYTNNKMDIYYKNVYAYYGETPEQYYTKTETGALQLASTGTPVAVNDIAKSGFDTDANGVMRYYDPSTGLPVLNQSAYEVGDKTYQINQYGAVVCDGENHLPSDNGMCPGCQTKFDGVSSLYGNSLVLGSDVQVVFYLDLATEGVKEVQVGFAREFTAGKQTKIAFSELKTVDVDGKTYYKVPYAIAAKDVYTKVQLKVIKTGESGDTEGTTYSYSVEDYVNAVNAKPTDSTYTEKLKALCNALLVYGSNARAELTKDDSYKKTPGTVTWATTYDYEANYDTEEMIKLYKISLDLKSNIKIKIYFTYDTDATYELDEYTITAGSKAVSYTQDGDVYCIEYEVAAKELDKGIKFVIKDEDDNGISFTISAVECARLENAHATEGSAMQYLMQSIKAYAEAAKDYTDAENNRID